MPQGCAIHGTAGVTGCPECAQFGVSLAREKVDVENDVRANVAALLEAGEKEQATTYAKDRGFTFTVKGDSLILNPKDVGTPTPAEPPQESSQPIPPAENS